MQGTDIKRLGNKVDHAQVQRPFYVIPIGAGTDNNHWGVLAGLPNGSHQIQAIAVGQVPVAQYQIGPLALPDMTGSGQSGSMVDMNVRRQSGENGFYQTGDQFIIFKQ